MSAAVPGGFLCPMSLITVLELCPLYPSLQNLSEATAPVWFKSGLTLLELLKTGAAD